MMSKALSMFDDDYVTKRMIEEFIIDEQKRYNCVKSNSLENKEVLYHGRKAEDT